MRTLTLWPTSRGHAPEALRPGADLTIDLDPSHGLQLAHGVTLDDHLDADTRKAVDADARQRYERWCDARASALTLERIDLVRVWEMELFAQCFLPIAKLLHGLPAAIAAGAAERILTRSVGPSLARIVSAVAAQAGIDAYALGTIGVREPILHAARSPLVAATSSLAVPASVRGQVLCIPHTSTELLVARLVRRAGAPRPVASRLLFASLGARGALAGAMRGGWLGVPGKRARAASHDTLVALLRAVSAADGVYARADESVDAAVDAHALATLERIAADTYAYVQHARSALTGGRIRAAMLPFDGPEQARMLLVALRDAGVQTLLVQHGFNARLGVPDMQLADRLAIWSERDRTIAPERNPAATTVTGNPSARHLIGMSRTRSDNRVRSIVLVDYPSRLSARIDGRVGMTHVAVALEALASARPGTSAVIRPHPADPRQACYLALAARHPRLRVAVNARAPIELLLRSGDLCVGALSTATLQACALGVPTVFLDVTGIVRPWPFDGTALPRARNAEELAHEIAAAIAGDDVVVVRDAACEALGVRADAVERVLELVAELAA